MEVEFHLDKRVTPVDVLYNSALSPLIKLGNSATREEHADSIRKRLLFESEHVASLIAPTWIL